MARAVKSSSSVTIDKVNVSSNKSARPNNFQREARDPQPVLGRNLPHNLEAEQGLVACLLMDGGQEIIGDCLAQRITADSFFHPNHQIIFQAVIDLYSANKPADLVLLSEQLKAMGKLDTIGGVTALSDFTRLIETTTHARHWLDVVRDTSMLRKLIRTTTSVAERAYSYDGELPQFIEEVEQTIFSISEERLSDSGKPVKEAIDQAVLQVQQMIQNKGVPTGIISGFTDIDRMTSGMHPQQMIVLAARPSVGKTSFAMNIAENVVLPRSGRPAVPTLVFSLEMGADQLAMRLLCSYARVKMGRLRDGFIDGSEQKALAQAANAIKAAPLWIDDSGYLTILELRAKARRMCAKNKVGLIVIDYLQLISGTDPRVPREQQIAEISRGIKSMAKELNIPIMVLSQLNRESEREKRRPRISDLRESGSIEQDADVVMLLSRKIDDGENGEYQGEDNMRELIIAKQRNGPIGSVPLAFIPDLTRFENFTSQTADV